MNQAGINDHCWAQPLNGLQKLRPMTKTTRTYKESTMMRRSLLLSAVAVSLLLPSGTVLAAEQQRDMDKTMDKVMDQKMDKTMDQKMDKTMDQKMDKTKAQKKVQTQERIYGSQLMTRQERVEFRAKMRAAKTAEEREQIRMQHHEQMKERAKAKGINLPDEPPAMGGHMGTGAGMGPGGGMGTGGGMGAGGGRK